MQCSKPLFRQDSSKFFVMSFCTLLQKRRHQVRPISRMNVFFHSKRKLVAWLKLILRNQTVVETLYQPWSYTVTTGTKRFKLQHLRGFNQLPNFTVRAQSRFSKVFKLIFFMRKLNIICQNSGFDDAFKLLDRLSLYVFDLPVNLAVQQFQQMEEAF